MLNRLFQLDQHGTTPLREIQAGATTFAAMAYILAVNPAILAAAGMPLPALVTVTALSAAMATVLMALLTNYPLALAPGIALVAVFMLLGGLLLTRRVARIMAENITVMDAEQGFVASLVTAILVLLASYAGLPVSTTHVSVGALFGIAVANRTAKMQTVATILVAWVTTLPLAAVIAAGLFGSLRALGL